MSVTLVREILSRHPLGDVVKRDRSLKISCSWCQCVIRNGVEPTSHGICQPCLAVHFPEAV